MSSDSDSDICDLSTDIDKFMQKSKERLEKKMNLFKHSKVENNIITTLPDIEHPPEKKPQIELNNSLEETQSTTGLNFDNRSMITRQFNASDQLPTVNQSTAGVPFIESGEQLNLQKMSDTISTSTSDQYASDVSLETRFNKLNQECVDLLQDLSGKRKRSARVAAVKRTLPARKAYKRKCKASPHGVPTIQVSSDEDMVVEVNEEVNPLVEVNLLWKSDEEKVFRVHKYDKLEVITKYLVNNYKVNPKLLLFTIDDKEIDLKNSTYVSLRLNEDVVIEGGTLPESYLEKGKSKIIVNQGIRLKVQFDRNKHFLVYLQPDDKLEILYSHVIRELNIPLDKFKVVFDGNTVKPSSTMTSLDVEQDDVFDVILT